jgi:hypothetical protein
MGLVISKGLTLARTFDPEITAYIAAVETADGQALEPAVKTAYINFILGCKADGIWNAIKASCILAGARTRLGALTPLVGTAPTSFNFVDGDYNRKTGLVGDGSTKYLNSNRNNLASPSNSSHAAVWNSGSSSATQFYMGTQPEIALVSPNITVANYSSRFSVAAAPVTGFIGSNRSNTTSVTTRANSTSTTSNRALVVPASANTFLFAGSPSFVNSDARLAFYSIGESLDLALLDARVTDLINAFAAAIP